ncbi:MULTISPECIES: hypothetical protein [Streptomyces]|uniref:hypothetical protein n=1 Tax=Streptomyces TaxID=1883 RepID=UPI000A62D81A|nr:MULTISPECIES: hypothetical protein [unclassified Streptomyces]QNQ34907.1 hypothetical protein HYC88_15145 [Streptomyces sp. CB00271]
MVDRIPVDVARIALDNAEGFPFERFANAFYASLIGTTFVPLGGIKDGGADARDGEIFQDANRPDAFYQASVEVDAEAKIRRTVNRLKEFGRTPRTLIYLTSRTVKYSDRVERQLTEDLDVTVVIRDGDYIIAHLNDDIAGRVAFDEHLRTYTDFLRKVGSSRIISASKHVRSPAAFVFLSQELERRTGNEKLVDSVVDSLALWALEATDPDAGILYDIERIQQIIDEGLPSVKNLVRPRLRNRLERMADKNYKGGRAVNWHRKNNVFCLPYEMRQRIEEENTADETLRLDVLASFDDRLQEAKIKGLGDVRKRQAKEIALRTLQLAFERNGLEFAAFLRDNENSDYATITDSLAAALIERGLTGRDSTAVGDGAFHILRGVLYDSMDVERRYLQRLSRTYALLFTLNTEPSLIDFFQEMTGEFRLYVGADQVVRALSEHYLEESDRMTTNTLLMAGQLGAKLILAEPVLDEVVHHLRICDFQYKNHVAEVDEYMNYEVARNAPHIMLRTYLYARINQDLGARRPKSWPAFIKNFCTYSDLHKEYAFEDVRRYLQSKFSLTFESTEDLESVVDPVQLDSLAAALEEVKKDHNLARHDALLALAVYGHRRRRKETSNVSEFGYATWWLTSETKILQHTREVVRKHRARYVMRPDFLLNFLTLAPSAATARKTFKEVFPSLLGIKLARRMNVDTFDEIMDSVSEATNLDEARRTAEIAKSLDKLKSDFTRQYTNLGAANRRADVDLVAERSVKPPDFS